MCIQTQHPMTGSTLSRLFMLLPGPTRRRFPTWYSYQLSYQNPRPDAAGCAYLWSVEGGREQYQVAVERTRKGQLRWHCTCADAVYRGEFAEHQCKHVRGLLAWGQPVAEMPGPLGFEAFVGGWQPGPGGA